MSGGCRLLLEGASSRREDNVSKMVPPLCNSATVDLERENVYS
jgi:hypothetical protein